MHVLLFQLRRYLYIYIGEVHRGCFQPPSHPSCVFIYIYIFIRTFWKNRGCTLCLGDTYVYNIMRKNHPNSLELWLFLIPRMYIYIYIL